MDILAVHVSPFQLVFRGWRDCGFFSPSLSFQLHEFPRVQVLTTAAPLLSLGAYLPAVGHEAVLDLVVDDGVRLLRKLSPWTLRLQ